MPKASHATMTLLSGLLWITVGFFLMRLGLNLINDAVMAPFEGYYPLLNYAVPYFNSFQGASIALIASSLVVGFLKGRIVLRKAAERGIARILSLPNPSPITQIYNARYFVLLALMVGLGLSIRFFGVPNDIRGGIDTAIGAALINGSAVYLRKAMMLYKAVEE